MGLKVTSLSRLRSFKPKVSVGSCLRFVDELQMSHNKKDLDQNIATMQEININFPRIISVKFTEMIAEIQMENVGISLERFF